MVKKLDRYREKRDAEATNEPFGDEVSRSAPTWRGAFVIHQHAATHLHWDLRLEIGGVLASFAVPHGPTLDTRKKHLAIQTEDHPIEYLDFEAVIPEGNYGGGPMIVWDWGVVRFLDESGEDGLVSGKLHFSLEGRKLRGRFGLVRVKPRDGRPIEKSRDWLLIKKTDAFASERDIAAEEPRSVLSGLTVDELVAMPEIAKEIEREALRLGGTVGVLDGQRVSPMLATLGDIPTKGRHFHELKLDGVRIIATKDERGVDLRYRSARSTTDSYPEVARAVAALPISRAILDGEIVSFDDRGRPDFERLASRIHLARVAELRRALVHTPVAFVVFDILAIGSVDVAHLPLSSRKALLGRLVPERGVMRVLDHLEGDGEKLFQFCRQQGLEGIVSKRADAPYRMGPQRTSDWIKTKCEQEALFVVIGHTRGESTRSRLGALDLGTYEGDELKVRGRAGSGLSEASIDDLLARLAPLATPKPTAIGTYEHAPRGRTHVRPELVVRVRYLEWSDDGNLRFPVYLGIEEGADPRSTHAAPHDDNSKAVAPVAIETIEEPPPSLVVRTTNRQKIFWPEEGYTKGDLLDYYDAISPVLLPYLRDRPIMLVRYPDGVEGKSFYQWNVPHGMPSFVRSVTLGRHARLPDEDADHKKNVFIIDHRESLLYIANLACIPVHVLGSRVDTPEIADFLTIDFDVALASLAAAIPLAHTLRSILDEVGLVGFPKTSGQTGLHVFVPLGDQVSALASRVLADLFGRLIAERHPDLATTDRVVRRRGARVYVDTGQTGPSRTIVAPYSVRATKGARVSTPLLWDEVTTALDPSAFTIKTVLERVERMGDPMATLLQTPVDLPLVMARLERELKGGPREPTNDPRTTSSPGSPSSTKNDEAPKPRQRIRRTNR